MKLVISRYHGTITARCVLTDQLKAIQLGNSTCERVLSDTGQLKGSFIPDLLALQDKGKKVAIEIVITNPVDEKKILYYLKKGIDVLIVRSERKKTYLPNNVPSEAKISEIIKEYEDLLQ